MTKSRNILKPRSRRNGKGYEIKNTTSDEVMASAIFEDSKENCVTYADFDAGWEAAIEWVKSGQDPVAWFVMRNALGKRDHGMKLGPFWKRSDAEEWVDDNHTLHAVFLHPAPAQPAVVQQLVEALELERKRLDFITEFGSCWRVTYMKNGNKPVKFRMTDEGEYWGKWHSTPREAIDVALKSAKEAGL